MKKIRKSKDPIIHAKRLLEAVTGEKINPKIQVEYPPDYKNQKSNFTDNEEGAVVTWNTETGELISVTRKRCSDF